jgi:hypothetical protein
VTETPLRFRLEGSAGYGLHAGRKGGGASPARGCGPTGSALVIPAGETDSRAAWGTSRAGSGADVLSEGKPAFVPPVPFLFECLREHSGLFF